MNVRCTMQAFAFEAKAPPAEIQLWNAGPNPTDYGVHTWSQRSADSIMSTYTSRGNPLLVDVEHNGAKAADGEPETIGGYAKLELRAGAPWLVFDWSQYAVEQISSGQRRFLSPEYEVDKATGEIVSLFRVSLVAEPGTHRARMLASAANPQEKSMDISTLLAALRAALAAEDPATAVASISQLVSELSSSDAAPSPEATAAPAAPPAPASEEKMAAASEPPAAEDDKKMQAAAPDAKPASDAIAAAKAAAVKDINNAHRDHILATQGERLEPSIRRWAATQSLDVVKGLLGATPAPSVQDARISATRGDTQGGAAPRGLQGHELDELHRKMGIFKASAGQPAQDLGTKFVFSSMTPSQARAAASAKAGK